MSNTSQFNAVEEFGELALSDIAPLSRERSLMRCTVIIGLPDLHLNVTAFHLNSDSK